MSALDPKPVDRESLLVNELAEINNYVRSWAAVYVSWYTMTFTVNVLEIGWLMVYNSQVGKALTLARCIFSVTALWDFLSVLGTLSIRAYCLSSDVRVSAILSSLSGGQQTASMEPHSPIPRRSASLVFGLAALALFVLVLLWTVLASFPFLFFG